MAENACIEEYSKMCREERHLTAKRAELLSDLQEHKMVIQTLSALPNSERRCYKVVGKVLVEKTAATIIPTLEDQMAQLTNVIKTFDEKIAEKKRAIKAYSAEHHIRSIPVNTPLDQIT